jgi:hypothetical protein
MLKSKGDDMARSTIWVSLAKKKKNTKRKPLKNNVKHENERRQRKALCQECQCHGIHPFESSFTTCNKLVPKF